MNKWFYTIYYSFLTMKGGFWSFFSVNIIRSVEFIAVIFVWKLNPNSTPAIISYLALGRAYERIYSNQFGGVLASFINNGTHTKILLYPVNFFWFYFMQILGYNVLRSSTHSLIILLLAVLFFPADLVFNFQNLIWLLAFIPINLVLQYTISFIIGCSGFWIKDRGDANNFTQACYTATGILGGGIIPLNIMFKDIVWLQYNPFAFLLHWPMQLYLQNDIALTKFGILGIALLWLFILYVLAQIIFKSGLKKNESVGL